MHVNNKEFCYRRFLNNFHSDSRKVKILTVEEVYVNSFDGTEVAWVEVGSSPYLHNTTTDYIYSDTNNQYESKFGFPTSAGSGTINSVKIRVEVMNTYIEIGSSCKVYVWDGSSWVLLGEVSSPDVYTWKEFDVTTILNTWDKINGAKLRFLSVVGDGAIYVRRATRKVDYGAVAPIKKPIMKMDLGPHPRSRLLFAPTLFLGAKTIPISPPPTWDGWDYLWVAVL
jgi:hypothetical protein